MRGAPGKANGCHGPLPRLVVTLEHCRCRRLAERRAGRRRQAHSAPRLDAALVSSRGRLITAPEASDFVSIIKASILGGEQQAPSLQMSARDEFG